MRYDNTQYWNSCFRAVHSSFLGPAGSGNTLKSI